MNNPWLPLLSVCISPTSHCLGTTSLFSADQFASDILTFALSVSHPSFQLHKSTSSANFWTSSRLCVASTSAYTASAWLRINLSSSALPLLDLSLPSLLSILRPRVISIQILSLPLIGTRSLTKISSTVALLQKIELLIFSMCVLQVPLKPLFISFCWTTNGLD